MDRTPLPAGGRPALRLVPKAPVAIDDGALVRALREGSPGAPELLWDRYASVVRGLLRRSLGPEDEVEDLVQDVFLRFFSRMGRLREPAALRSFLLGIAVRVLRSELRRRRVRRRFGGGRDSLRSDLADAVGSNAEPAWRMRWLLDQLKPETKILFLLRYVEGLDVAEIASTLEVSLATAKRRLRRANDTIASLAGQDPLLAQYMGLSDAGKDGDRDAR